MAQAGPSSQAVPKKRASNLPEGERSARSTNRLVIPDNGILARLVQHESGWPASVPEQT